MLCRAAFTPPYFKDVYGMVRFEFKKVIVFYAHYLQMPQLNVDTQMIQNICSLNLLMRKEKVWTQDELKTLRDGVIAQLRDGQVQESRVKLVYLEVFHLFTHISFLDKNICVKKLPTIEQKMGSNS